jgi:hypothetical protein
MRRFRWLALGLVAVLAMASPGDAVVATIVTTAPLPDHSERSVEAAFHDAVRAAVTEAMAMGLPWVQFSHALVLEDAVRVEILATDAAPDAGAGQEEHGSDTAPRAGVVSAPPATWL